MLCVLLPVHSTLTAPLPKLLSVPRSTKASEVDYFLKWGSREKKTLENIPTIHVDLTKNIGVSSSGYIGEMTITLLTPSLSH